ncbi:Fic family protein [Geodermatophilus pulveris]|uniref:Fic family protein n=1 Tax=Geodermatophilus pulveris TaxID=1564159 RepID=UPI0015C5F8B6|nr:Fic family protein [Geodermatophilus pulveris]
MITLEGSPYCFDEVESPFLQSSSALAERVALLRGEGTLRDETLRAYFGDKRFEEVAESNAIEGSTLDVRETQLAVLSGIAVTGHDPAYVRDAINLARALDRTVELASQQRPTDIEQVKEVHALILGERPGAGVFRSEAIRISGSEHRPPKTWRQVMDAMDEWERWSLANVSAPPVLRAVVLHTWLTHIHPFLDGNGRTARAILNLEFIRSGYPSVILRKKDRVRYYEALAESDRGGDLGPIGQLVADRCADALGALERAARAQQGYNEVQVRLREAQKRQVGIWNDAVRLLFSLTEDALQQAFGAVGQVRTTWYDAELSLEDYLALLSSDPSGNSWIFRFDVSVPAVGETSYLAWAGFRSDRVRAWSNIGAGPSIFWSVRDATGSKPWVRRDELAPGGAELTLKVPDVDRWIVREASGEIGRRQPSELARSIVRGVEGALGDGS